MMVVVSDFLQKNPTKLNFVPAMGGLITSFTDLTTQIGMTHEAQLVDSKGHTLAKEVLRQNLLSASIDLIKRVKAYSSISENYALIDDVNYSWSDLNILAQNNLSDISHKIIQVCTANMTVLAEYGVDQSLLDEAIEKLTAFNESLPEVKKVIAGRKVATSEIVVRFAEADRILKKIDALMEIISSSDAFFYQEYKNLRMIDDLRRKQKSHNHSMGITGVVVNLITGLKQPGVTVSVAGTNINTLTDSEGKYSIELTEPGIYSLKAVLKGFAESNEDDVEVETGKITEVDFDIEPEE